MRRVVEYRNLTFASSDDGILQIWFEAQCDEENLLVRIYGHSRDTSFERITPQVLTGWALYRSSKPKGLVSGIYASLLPQGSSGRALKAVERHLQSARQNERRLREARAQESEIITLYRNALKRYQGGEHAE